VSRFECPECGGGFPSPALDDGQNACPWCGETFHALMGVSLTAEQERRRSEETARYTRPGDRA